jgi:hypothetical protein
MGCQIAGLIREAYDCPITLDGYTQLEAIPKSRGAVVRKGKNNQPAKELPQSGSGTAGNRDSGKQLTRLRRICRSIPGATEKVSHGEPTFFTHGRVFAMFADNHHGDGHVAVWLPAADGVQTALIEEAPETYFRPPYVGVRGWVGVEISKVDDDQLGALLREAFRLIDLKSASAPRAKPLRSAAQQTRSRTKKRSVL